MKYNDGVFYENKTNRINESDRMKRLKKMERNTEK